MTDFAPRVSHLLTFLALAVLLASGGDMLSDYPVVSWTAFGAAAFCGWLAIAWSNALMAEAATRRYVDEQEAARWELEAATRFGEMTAAKLPPAAFLQAMANAFPELNWDDITLEPEGAQLPQAPDGWNIMHTIPGGLCTDDQFRTLAHGYEAHGLTIGYWTETQQGRPPVISRLAFDKLLDELVVRGMATKDDAGVTRLNESGDAWLQGYL